MFTVKTITDGNINIRTEDEITIVRKGSQRFSELLKRFEHVANPDFAIETPAVFADAEMKEALQEESIIFSDRYDISLDVQESCIAIIITDHKSLIRPDVKHFNGSMYEFIYSGDGVYIMNQSGATVEVVR